MVSLSPERIRLIVVEMVTLILSIAVHEFGHAFVADKLGDRTPRGQGRVTLNPFAHADPIGTIALPLVGLLSGGGTIGWGRPVQINPVQFTRSMAMATGRMLVAAAGPTMNILFALLISGIYAVLLAMNVALSEPVTVAIWSAVQLNFFLAAFNLVPVEPLDGGAVLKGLLPRSWSDQLRFTEQYGWVVLMVIMFSPLRAIYVVPASWAFRTWMGLVLGTPHLGS